MTRKFPDDGKRWGHVRVPLTAFLERVGLWRRRNDTSTQAARFLGEFDASDARWHGLVVPSVRRNDSHMLRYYDRADWRGVDERIAVFAASFCDAAMKEGVPLYVHTAYRTPDEQWKAFRKGTSRATPSDAPHCRGAAVDIVHAHLHWQMAPQEWAYLGKFGKDLAQKLGLKVEWGGDWSFYDPAHWQLSDWRALPLVEAHGDPVRRTPRKILAEARLAGNMS